MSEAEEICAICREAVATVDIQKTWNRCQACSTCLCFQCIFTYYKEESLRENRPNPNGASNSFVLDIQCPTRQGHPFALNSDAALRCKQTLCYTSKPWDINSLTSVFWLVMAMLSDLVMGYFFVDHFLNGTPISDFLFHQIQSLKSLVLAIIFDQWYRWYRDGKLIMAPLPVVNLQKTIINYSSAAIVHIILALTCLDYANTGISTFVMLIVYTASATGVCYLFTFDYNQTQQMNSLTIKSIGLSLTLKHFAPFDAYYVGNFVMFMLEVAVLRHSLRQSINMLRYTCTASYEWQNPIPPALLVPATDALPMEVHNLSNLQPDLQSVH